MSNYTLIIEKDENIFGLPLVLEFITPEQTYSLDFDELHVDGADTNILIKDIEVIDLDIYEENSKDNIARVTFGEKNNYPVVYSKAENKISFEHDSDEWSFIRDKRNKLLEKSDLDSGILWPDLWESRTAEEQTAWKEYRQALRDVTNAGASERVTWPTPPSNTVDSA